MPCSSSAISAYAFDESGGILELVFAESRMIYDYPCDALLYDEFVRAPSKGRFVNGILKPHADRHGWTPTPRPFTT